MKSLPAIFLLVVAVLSLPAFGRVQPPDAPPRPAASAAPRPSARPTAPPPADTGQAVQQVLAQAVPDRTQTAPAPLSRGDGSALLTFLRMLASLALVLAAAYGVSLLLRRLNLQRLTTRSELLSVEESLPLGQGRALYVVKVGARRLLLGASAQQVSLLSDLTHDPQAAPLPSFAAQVAEAADRTGLPPTASPTEGPRADTP